MCNSSEIAVILSVIKAIYDIMKFIIPIYLIIVVTVDVFKMIIAKSDDDTKKIKKIIVNRAVSGIMFFLIPTFVFFVLGTIVNSETMSIDNIRDCWDLA